MKKFQKILALILVISMFMSLSLISVSAADELIDKTAQWADEGKTIADVTLSVPGDVKVEGADIVFVIDKSTCGPYATNQFKEMFQELAAAQAQSGATIKVGLVQFNYTDHMDIPLTELTADNVDDLLGKIGYYEGGTNIESGLLTAKQMLDADTSVSAKNKHVILISDGLTWVYDDENGNPHTMLHEYTECATDKKPAGTVDCGTHSYSHARGVSYVGIPEGYTWNTYWEKIIEWVEADAKSGFSAKYDYDISDYRSADYKERLKTEEAKELALTDKDFQDHATNMDRAMYDAWLAYTALQGAGYNCYVNNATKAGSVYVGSNGDHFMNMLAGDQEAVDFESIKDTIIYSVAAGSYVEDVIGYGDDYNFDFLVDGKITLTVGGVEYITTKLETAEEGFDVSYSFAAEGKEATFWLDYVKGNGLDEEKFIWTFGENLSAFYPAKLDYQVKLVSIENDPTEAVAKVETNKSAILQPVDNEGNPGTPVVFPVPELEIPKYKVTYEYVGTVPTEAPALPAVAYYFAGNEVTVESDSNYMLSNYKFFGWHDPCNYLTKGIMPAHDVTLTGYYLPINDMVDPPIGIKTDKEKEGDGYQYDVTISVPGDGEAVKIHDEIILVIDGSYSGDDEWADMKKNIIQIGEKVLGGAGRTEMTVIAFGMDDNIVVEGIKTVAELEAMLPSLPGGLLYGRSSTNCEVGFTGALKYIQEKQAELSKVDVIFISDGGINTNDIPRAFGSNWQEWATCFGAVTTAQAALEYTLTYGTNLPAAFTTVFGDRFANMTNEQILAAAYATDGTGLTDEDFLEFGDQLWADVYAAAGMTLSKEYPISEVEYAFVKYDEDNGTFIQDIFYWTTYRSSHVTYPHAETAERTMKAAKDLAACDLVNKLYLLRYTNDSRAWWMEELGKTENDNIDYYQAANVDSLLNGLSGMLTELSQTNYTNVVITDYMSKWVLLHTDSIYIKNDTTGEIIWTITEGWKSETDRPTSKTPVTIEVVESNQYYAEDGKTLETNVNGVIYKLTWNVKDDCLLRTDNYSLHYTVTVDTEEPGFVPGVEYPANGHTYVDYEENGHNDIDVPNVAIPAYTVTYLNGEITLQKTESLATGDVIPGCEEPETYEEDGYVYTFIGWRLVSGVEGADNTIGTTDLVYEAMFEVEEIVELPDEENPLGPPQTGDAITAAIIAALASLMGVCVLPKRKEI